MSTTAISDLSSADIPSTPEGRLREVAAILATGLLRLRTRPELAPGAAVSGAHAASEIAEESGGEALGFPAHLIPDVRNG